MWNGLRRLLGLGSGGGPALETVRSIPDRDWDGPLIELDGLSKVFIVGDVQTHALRDVHLKIQRGEFVGVDGPSGSGKTTLLSVVGLLDSPSAGSYTLNGVDVTNVNAAHRAWLRNREIGFIFQSFNLIGDLSVFENVELPLTYHGMAASERRDRVAAVLDSVDMTARTKQMPGQLSGGQQQRVAVARAIVVESSCWPTSQQAISTPSRRRP